jgi:hypothetical protein
MITIESNVLQVARNFEQQIREQPNIVKTALGRTAEFLMFLIKQRTARGSDYQGNSFVKYTPEYARVRKAKGLPTTPDLFFKGNMMSGMTQRSSPTQAQITFSSVRENSKALWNQKTRKFFAIGDKEAPLLKNKFMDEYNRLMKI